MFSMRTKLVILSAFLSPFRSGAEAMVEEVALHLADQFEITIITSRLQRSLPRKDVLGGRIPIIRVGFGSPLDKYFFPLLAPLAARRVQPEIVHAVLESYAGLALIFCQLIVPRAKRVLTLQSTNTSFLLGPMHRAAHHITAISSVLVERAKKFGRTDVELIPNGIDFQSIQAACVHSGKIPGRLLFVGRLEPMKGVDTLIEAFARAAGSGQRIAGSLHLNIVGDGSLRQALEAQAKALSLGGKVSFLGRLTGKELFTEYAEAQIFCGLSRSEALGNVFLEAQAAGCAVTATRVGGIVDIVRDHENGLLVAPDCVDQATAAIVLLLTDEALRKRITENAQKHAEKYDWSGIAERYAAALKKLA
jgi:glycosyltransferase involved in cell wall biosynthesis